MFKFLLFACNDILRSKSKSFVFLIQMLVIILIFNITFSLFMQLNDFNNKIEQLKEKIEITNYAEDVNDGVYVKTNKEVYNEFYNFVMKVTEGKAFSFMSSELEFNNLNVSNNFIARVEENKKFYSVLYASSYMKENYNWKCISGRTFIESDYENQKNQKYIPIILGYYYNKYYNVNNIIDNKYIVVGVLKKDEFYLNPRWRGNVNYLNDTIIIPMNYETTGWGGAFLNQLNVLTTDNTIMELIVNKAKDLGLQDIKFREMKDQLSYIEEEVQTRLRIYLGIAILLLVLCIISEVSTLLHMIERKKREFVINIMCGATKKDINVRLCFQVILILFASIILSCCIYRNIANLFLSLLSIIIIAFFVLTIPLYRLHKQSISEMLKRKE